MFRILQDSIFNPKGLVKQVNRSGFFVFLYLLVMAIFMSIGTFVAYAAYENPTFTTETTGCFLQEEAIVCDGDNYDVDNLFYVYGFRVYFLDSDMSIDDIPNLDSDFLIVKGESITFYLNQSAMGSLPVFTDQYGATTLEDGMQTMVQFILITSIASSLITNFFLILAIVLISSLMFIRYKKFIAYKKLFKLITYAITPVALLITFYNLIQFNFIIFFIVSIFAYRTLFTLNRELYTQMMIRLMKQQNEDPSVVDSYQPDDFDTKDEESTEKDDSDDVDF